MTSMSTRFLPSKHLVEIYSPSTSGFMAEAKPATACYMQEEDLRCRDWALCAFILYFSLLWIFKLLTLLPTEEAHQLLAGPYRWPLTNPTLWG